MTKTTSRFGTEPNINRASILALSGVDTLEAGEHRFNHDDCPAGTDTKRRLYVLVPSDKPDQRVVYCHNCQRSGYAYVKGSDTKIRKRISAQGADTKSKEFVAPPVTLDELAFDTWPVTARNLVLKAGLTEAAMLEHGIFWSPLYNRIVYSYYSYNNHPPQLVSQQLRDVSGDEIKYLSIDNPSARWKSYPIGDTDLDTLVITEDLLSAVRCVETGLVRALPLRGCNLSVDRTLELFTSHAPRKVLVWLDNDSSLVCATASSIRQKMLSFLPATDATVYTREEEPKHLDNDTLTRILS